MIDRRSLIKGGLVAVGVATLSVTARVGEPDTNTTGVDGYTYRLPSFARGSRLLFQGDSITWGRLRAGRDHYLGHGYVYLIAARLGVEMPEVQLDIYNRGRSGNGIAQVRKRWQTDAIDVRPDLLSILVGTNDAGIGLRHAKHNVTPAAFESDYRSILDASRKENPALRLVLLDPFILFTGSLENEQNYRTRRDATDKLRVVIARLAKDYDAVHVQTQEIFDSAAEVVTPEHWMWDDIHPLPQGHELIARHWLQEVSARWPQA